MQGRDEICRVDISVGCKHGFPSESHLSDVRLTSSLQERQVGDGFVQFSRLMFSQDFGGCYQQSFGVPFGQEHCQHVVV